MKRTIILALAIGLALILPPPPSHSQMSDDVDAVFPVTLPPGSVIAVLMQEPVSTETAIEGQPISAIVAQDIYSGSARILAFGDRVTGRVISSFPPENGRNARLKIGFDTLILTSGARLPLSSFVDTGKPDRQWGGELTPGTEPVVIPYNIHKIGTYGRVVYRGKRAMGEHISLQPSQRVVVVLEAPLNLYAIAP